MTQEFEILNAKIEFTTDASKSSDDIAAYQDNVQKAAEAILKTVKNTKDLAKAFKDIDKFAKISGSSMSGLKLELADSGNSMELFLNKTSLTISNVKKLNSELKALVSTSKQSIGSGIASAPDVQKPSGAQPKPDYSAVVAYNKEVLSFINQQITAYNKLKQIKAEEAAADFASTMNSRRMQKEVEQELAGIEKVAAAKEAATQRKLAANAKLSAAESARMQKETEDELAAIQKKEAEDAKRNAAIQKSIASFNSTAQEFVNFDRSILKVAGDLSTSFGIISDGGSKMGALKLALFGLKEATGTTGIAFNSLSKAVSGVESVTNLFASKQDKLKKSLLDTVTGLTNQATAVRKLSTEFKELAKTSSGVNKQEFALVEESIQNITNEYQRLQRIIMTGGKASGAEINRLKVEFEAAEQSIKLVKGAYAELGPEGEVAFKKILSSVRSLKNGLDVIEQQSKRIGVEEEKSAAKAAQALAKTDAEIKKSGYSWQWLFNLFKSGKNDINNVSVAMEKTSRSSKLANEAASGFAFTLFSFTGGMLGGGLAMTIPAVFATLQTKITGAISAASEANESMSKFATVFDSNLDPAIAEADSLVQSMVGKFDELAETLGRSKYELREMGAAFQDTFVPLGFSREEAAKLSLSLVGLTEDLSSFYNMTEKEVSDRVSSFLVGNYENARAFGVIVNDAALDAELLKMGVAKGTQAVDQQVKSLVALKLLYAGTSDAQGDVIRTSDQFANMMREIQGASKDAAVELGLKFIPIINPLLAMFIRIKNEVGPSIANIFNGMYNAILPLSDALISVINGANSFDDLRIIAYNGLISLLDTMNSFIPEATNWAWAWGVEIYNGLINVANTLIADAASYIGSIIASFLQPGSPPEQGPLSTIDKWGIGLMSTFSEGFQSSKVDLLTSILSPVADALAGSGKSTEFTKIQNGLADIIELAVSSGNVDTAKVDELLTGVLPTEEIEQTKKVLEEKAKLMKLQKDLETAKASGDYSSIKSIKSQITSQEEVVSTLESRISAAKKIEELEAKVAEKQEKGASNALAAAQGLAGANNASKDALEKYQKTSEETYQEELDNAQLIYDEKMNTATSEEDRLVALQELKSSQMSAEKKYYGTLEGTMKQQSAQRIAQISKEADVVKQQLADIRKVSSEVSSGGTGKAGLMGLSDLGLSVEDFLPKPEDVPQVVYTFASKVATETTTALTTKMETVKNTFAQNISLWLSAGIEKIKEFFTGLKPDQIFPVSILVGIFASPVIDGFFHMLAMIPELLLKIGPSLSALIPIIKTLVGWIFKWSVAGLIVYGIFTQWDELVIEFGLIIDHVKNSFNKFIDNIKTMWDSFSQGDRATRILTNVGNAISYAGTTISQVLGLAMKIFKKGIYVVITAGLIEILDLVNYLIDSMGGAAKIGDAIGSAFERASQVMVKFFEYWFWGTSYLYNGDFIGFFNAVADSFTKSGLLDLVNNIFTGIGTALVSLESYFIKLGESNPVIKSLVTLYLSFKQTVIDAFNQIVNNFTLATSTSKLFMDLWESVKLLFIQLWPLLVGIAAIVGVILVAGINFAIAAFQGIVAVIPYVVGAIEGVITTIDGFVKMFNGAIMFIAGIIRLNIGIFTGDFTTAFDLIAQGLTTFNVGVMTAIGGILQTIVNLGVGILGFISETVLGFMANLALMFGNTELATQLLVYKQTITQVFYYIITTVTATLQQLPVVLEYWLNEASTYVTSIFNTFLSRMSEFTSAVYLVFTTLGTTLGQLPLVVEAAIEWLGGRIVAGADYIKTIPDTIYTTFSQIGAIIVVGINKAGNALKNEINVLIQPFKDWYDILVGHSIVPDTMDAVVKSTTKDMPAQVESGFANGGLAQMLGGFFSFSDTVSNILSSIGNDSNPVDIKLKTKDGTKSITEAPTTGWFDWLLPETEQKNIENRVTGTSMDFLITNPDGTTGKLADASNTGWFDWFLSKEDTDGIKSRVGTTGTSIDSLIDTTNGSLLDANNNLLSGLGNNYASYGAGINNTTNNLISGTEAVVANSSANIVEWNMNTLSRLVAGYSGFGNNVNSTTNSIMGTASQAIAQNSADFATTNVGLMQDHQAAVQAMEGTTSMGLTNIGTEYKSATDGLAATNNTALGTATTNMQTALTTQTAGMQTTMDGFITNANLSLDALSLNWTTKVGIISSTWFLFTNTLYSNLVFALQDMWTSLSLFFTDAGLGIDTIEMNLANLILQIMSLGTTIDVTKTNMNTAVQENIRALENLIDVVMRVKLAYEKMAEAAREAARAAAGTLGQTGLVNPAPIGGYAKGTDFVPETGVYLLHKGEAVFTAKEAEQWRNVLAGVDTRNLISTKMNNAMNANVSSVNNTKSANVVINANYQETKSPATIKDDVYTSLRLAGYGI